MGEIRYMHDEKLATLNLSSIGVLGTEKCDTKCLPSLIRMQGAHPALWKPHCDIAPAMPIRDDMHVWVPQAQLAWPF